MSSDVSSDPTVAEIVRYLFQNLNLYRELYDRFPDAETFVQDNTLFYQEGLPEQLFVTNPSNPNLNQNTNTIYRMLSEHPIQLCQECQVKRMQQWVQQHHTLKTKYHCAMPIPNNDLHTLAQHLKPSQRLLYPSVRHHLMVPAKVQFLSSPTRIEITQVITDLTPQEHQAFLEEFFSFQQFLNQARQGSYRCDKCCPTFLHYMFKFQHSNQKSWQFRWPRNCFLPRPFQVQNEYGAACKVWDRIRAIENEKKIRFHTATDVIQYQGWIDKHNVFSASKMEQWVEQVMQGIDPDDLPHQPTVKPWYHSSSSSHAKNHCSVATSNRTPNNTIPRLTMADVMVIKTAKTKLKRK